MGPLGKAPRLFLVNKPKLQRLLKHSPFLYMSSKVNTEGSAWVLANDVYFGEGRILAICDIIKLTHYARSSINRLWVMAGQVLAHLAGQLHK